MTARTGSLYGRLSNFTAAKVDWIWKFYLARGMITVMDGDPGIGKSFVAMQIAAQMSIGGALPGTPKLQEGDVFYLTLEDDPAYTILPRITAMGGNSRKIYVQTEFSPFDEDGLVELEKMAEKIKPILIIIDPLYSFVDSEKDIYRPNVIREILGRLQEVATIGGSALLLIRHLRKMGGDKAIYQGAGAIDVVAVARCGIMVARDPEDPDLKVFAHSKHNLSRRMESLTYKLQYRGDDQQPAFQWVGRSPLSADDLIKPSKKADDGEREHAIKFLKRELADGPVPSKQLITLAEEAGISKRTLDRAKEECDARSIQRDGGWIWELSARPKPTRRK